MKHPFSKSLGDVVVRWIVQLPRSCGDPVFEAVSYLVNFHVFIHLNYPCEQEVRGCGGSGACRFNCFTPTTLPP